MQKIGVAPFAVLLLSSSSFGGLQFRPLVLDQMGHTYIQPRAINDAGTAVGGVFNTFGNNGADGKNGRAVVWDAETGSGTLLGAPTNYAGAVANDINNHGVIVGSVSTSSDAVRAMRHADGSFFLPSTFTSGRLSSINDAGHAVGVIGGQPTLLEGQTITDLNGAQTNTGAATAINSSGVIAGSQFMTNPSAYRAYRYAAGQTPIQLESTSLESRATAVSDDGTIVGAVYLLIPGQTVVNAVPVSFGIGTYTPLAGGFDAIGTNGGIARAINDQGWIGGARGMSTSSTADLTAALWINGEYLVPTAMLPQEYAGLLKINDIYGINNRGQMIAAARQDIDGDPSTVGWKNIAVRLDPIRSPGDTNYDDAVDFTDLLTLAQHYGQSGNGNVFWEAGDFNFDWAVDFDDLLTIAQHYSADSFESDWALAHAIVPEPVGAAAMLPLLMIRRRR